MSMYYVYVLQSESDLGLYIGSSADLKRRLRQHEAGESQATAHRGPWRLIYYEAYRGITGFGLGLRMPLEPFGADVLSGFGGAHTGITLQDPAAAGPKPGKKKRAESGALSGVAGQRGR